LAAVFVFILLPFPQKLAADHQVQLVGRRGMSVSARKITPRQAADHQVPAGISVRARKPISGPAFEADHRAQFRSQGWKPITGAGPQAG